MKDIVICVENLGKQYRIGKRERYKALRDTLTDIVAAPLRGAQAMLRREARPEVRPDEGQFWALKDVSFEVRRGAVVGIIGRNGAGKSTLLKILSRITRPTEGRVGIRGRIGSLLEVGTGFHPELTGRENVYLNGAMLGMRRAEITGKFDEIVAFAEVEQFIDTPVKHYSSGMYMRLAFAVAAHLEPEILVVDEVLAVGDVQFQKKCLGKLGEVAKEGRTVLFVSHQLNQIRRLCDSTIWMEQGQVQQFGATTTTVGAYEAALSAVTNDPSRSAVEAHIPARFVSWEILAPAADQRHMLTTVGPITFRFALHVNSAIRNGSYGVALYNSENHLMWAHAASHLVLTPGLSKLDFTLPYLPLRPGVYRWLVSITDPDGLLDLWNCSPELIIATEPVTHTMDVWQGALNVPWQFEVH